VTGVQTCALPILADCGNLADETAAALLVVKDLGRSHVKIRGLRGKSSLFCFYAKIIGFSGVKEFERTDGKKGLIARLTVADDTGQVDLVFWDEQAAALEETFEIGDVVEIIGRRGRTIREIMPLNMRKTYVDIDCVMEMKEQKLLSVKKCICSSSTSCHRVRSPPGTERLVR
jgi:replication factor A1